LGCCRLTGKEIDNPLHEIHRYHLSKLPPVIRTGKSKSVTEKKPEGDVHFSPSSSYGL
jgi:hypothetical protein